jgi:hypothetical protein
MTNKEYKIETITDIIKCTTPENLDNFLKDLKGIVLGGHLVLATLSDENKDKVYFGDFVWIDDNEHNITITLEEDKKQ